jgi:hypothetical protein
MDVGSAIGISVKKLQDEIIPEARRKRLKRVHVSHGNLAKSYFRKSEAEPMGWMNRIG